MPLIDFRDVSFANDGKNILRNVSFVAEDGDFISLVGSSGSGKSTLLKLCSHLISPTTGYIFYKGVDMTEYSPTELRKSISYCSQLPYLFGSAVKDNLDFPFSIRNMPFNESRVKELFSLFNISFTFLNADIQNLSGGEKQRISLVRTLLFLPEVLLLDEVTSSLDAENTRMVEDAISSLNRGGITVLWITHDPEQSQKYANKVITLEAGEIRSLEVLK
ncbi:ATP-binding cassette domain-containing protein [uncultured Methanomethylovorans sp.]|uniref:ABC transporter ATP-binding protein n=1 Tax=uncultured Methanomethylovorans sp. TaxID=183759 RepID=UPI002AA72192|nr:ATP-binding cassette domain-containing protein [uncultured Methanomethylovorans sp.]